MSDTIQVSKSRDSYEWTSLRGHDRIKLLDKLPSKLPSLFVSVETGEAVKSLWTVSACITSTCIIAGPLHYELGIQISPVSY